MSTHLVHILHHQSALHADRGCLLCRCGEQERRLPLADVLVVVVAARGVSFSGAALSALMRCGAIIVHCDDCYRPVGKTVGLPRVVQSGVFERQIQADEKFNAFLWDALLRAKINNQAAVLDKLDEPLHTLHKTAAEGCPDEGNAARQYWKYYFRRFGRSNPRLRTGRGAQDSVNGMLNYGYAVLSAVLHRSMIAHGLNPALGVHHKYRFRSEPLLYDLFEPLRPIVDYALVRFRRQYPRKELEEWVRFAAADMMRTRITTPEGRKLKLFNAVDYFVQSVCGAFCDAKTGGLYVPLIKDISFAQE